MGVKIPKILNFFLKKKKPFFLIPSLTKTSPPSCALFGLFPCCSFSLWLAVVTVRNRLRPSPAVKVKVATQKLQIFTLTTPTVKNTPTILFILLFISLKYCFLIIFFY
jgi:hypothetical protein